MKILTNQGIAHKKLTPEFASLLGDGGGILAEASITDCEYIEPVHFLGYLAKIGGSILRVEFLERRGVDPDYFCEKLYGSVLDEDRQSGVLIAFDLEALSPSSLKMFEAFEQEMEKRQIEQGNEALFLFVFLKNIEDTIRSLLIAIIGSQELLERFHQSLGRRIYPPKQLPIFDETDQIVEAAFDKSGKRVLNMLREETAGLGFMKATAMHLLYALVGIENGMMQRGIPFQAIDPIKEVHGYLSRELTRPGAKRVKDFQLRRDTLQRSVIRTLKTAAGSAQKENLPIGELHIARSLLATKTGLIVDFLSSRKVNLDVLREYLARVEVEEEDSNDNLRLPIKEIEAELKKQILGQDHAIRQILPWIKRFRFKFPRERGAAAVLLFLGPSGTGKTQLAKELARTVYGSPDELLMLEMGQFNSKESINMFVGASPGYVGYGEGKLTNGLRDKPECVVLFDEIEKAHEDVWVALLRFLDEGLISDPAGPTRDGRRCIIVLTSNLGADTLAQDLPISNDDGPQMNYELEQAIRDTILPYLKRPEIYNRVDDKIVFRPFSFDTYRTMVERQVKTETRKFVDLRGTEVEVQPDVLEWLAEQSIEAKKEGARCVPRIVNKFIVAPVIDLLTDNEDRTIRKLIISKKGMGTVAEEI